MEVNLLTNLEGPPTSTEVAHMCRYGRVRAAATPPRVVLLVSLARQATATVRSNDNSQPVAAYSTTGSDSRRLAVATRVLAVSRATSRRPITHSPNERHRSDMGGLQLVETPNGGHLKRTEPGDRRFTNRADLLRIVGGTGPKSMPSIPDNVSATYDTNPPRNPTNKRRTKNSIHPGSPVGASP